ncbi:hypothetical protein J3T92_02655 [Bifidobacterium sp. B4081]|uniref:hypothetical protein n=1 Tax=unclassified Bifidobacterium TaxID=2608897 RepID=UPI00226A6DD8|nr:MULTISPECIES: hypothetical protein [unclassified Bifidobacterium]MCX8643329.1 hypothetical protein [Bifidobacterium sp. B4077]MCX8645511.1 hypothetical protein [Bifidobacterium sp. B4081]MCX8668778.1 hypothetical protein [Bifidobacterium sp. B3998]
MDALAAVLLALFSLRLRKIVQDGKIASLQFVLKHLEAIGDEKVFGIIAIPDPERMSDR